ncbi:helix-turn-helix domain-containing protein [Clostridium grantii]|uniref:AraC-type DNA-binding protein n=1 Tax=Clostridium grantii DSM 8605 TaxID=1121316 RepID=A0A1M5XRS5_9CLOT|nr:helix-turn-helix domain-containing protein [Clostridium grantii]SHI02521.1 AraC-type DNA-binding protein [Clostridium grantii DSM 8605]
MKKKYYFNSVIKIWFITYIIVLLVPLLVNYFLFIHSRAIIQEEINSGRNAMLTQLKSNIDEKLQSIRRTGILVTNEPKFLGVINDDKKGVIDNNKYEIIELANFISLLRNSNNNIESIMLYLKNSNNVFYNKTYMNNQYIYNNHVNLDIFETYDQWYDFLNQKYRNEFVLTDIKTPEGNPEKYISYAMSLPYGNLANSNSTLFISIKQDQIINILDDYKISGNGIVYILDENNNIIASNVDMKIPELLEYENLINNNTIYFGKYDKKEVAALMTESDETNWKYIILADKEIFSKKMFNYSKIVLFATFIYTIIGIILAFLFTNRNYKPIKKIVQLISIKSLTERNSECNDYLYLQESFERAFFEMDEMHQTISQQNDLLRRNFIYRLLNGEIRDKVLLETSLNKFEIEFNYDYYSVFIVHIDFCQPKENFSTDITLMKIAEYFNQIELKKSKLYHITRENYIIFITNSDLETQNKLNRELHTYIDQLKLQIEQFSRLSLSVAVSNIHDSILGITEAYQESLNCLDYILVYEPDEILSYKDIESKDAYYYPISIEQKLINYIKAGNIEEANALLQHVYDKNFKENLISMNMGKSLMFDICASILKVVDYQNTNEMINQEKLLKSIIFSKNLREMMDSLVKVLCTVCKYFKCINEKTEKIAYSKEINSYIEENYSNSDLNISTLAEHFNLTPSYLSKLYKMETDEGILTYINKIRVDKSKSLLLETDQCISEIAEKVGILHDTSFNRIFKNNEGITPGQYRKNNKII